MDEGCLDLNLVESLLDKMEEIVDRISLLNASITFEEKSVV